ncbi:MAG: NINE protein [Muribaculaceae bacterium]
MIQHQCPSCHRQFTTEQASVNVKCPYCGTEFSPAYNQGYQQGFQQGYNSASGGTVFDCGPSGRSRGVAALLAIFLGALGIHYFYLGKNTAGIVFLLIAIFSCGVLAAVTSVLALVQGIIMLTLTQEQFEQKYVYCPQSIPLF